MSDKVFQLIGLSKVEHTQDGEFVTITASVKDGPDIMLEMPLEGLGEIITRLTRLADEAGGRRGIMGQFEGTLDDGTEIYPLIVNSAEVASTNDREWVVFRFHLPDKSCSDFAMAPTLALELGERLTYKGRLCSEDPKRYH